LNQIAATLTVALTAGLASGQATIEFLPPGYVLTGLATGGTTGAGNVTGDLTFETFRWTSTGGTERLGQATVPVLQVGAGTPDISYDGQSISASILSTDLLMTQGVWRSGIGWVETMPPPPATGQILGVEYGSAWGLSGDGQTVTGFHWGTVGMSTRARASKWSESNGMISLPQNDGRDARVNAANADGSVVVGWEARPDGNWRPTAWRDAAKITLEDTLARCQAAAVNWDGSVIVGSSYDAPEFMREAARWVWNGGSYDMTLLGVLPGTQANFGEAMLTGVSGDGSLGVGWNRYSQGPASPITGIVWTPSGGLVNATDFIAGLGLASAFTADMDIRQLSAVSPDGSAFTGWVWLSSTGEQQSFVIHITPPPCTGDANGDRVVNFDDILSVLANFGIAGPPFVVGDSNGTGTSDFTDIITTLANFNGTCP